MTNDYTMREIARLQQTIQAILVTVARIETRVDLLPTEKQISEKIDGQFANHIELFCDRNHNEKIDWKKIIKILSFIAAIIASIFGVKYGIE